MRPFDEQRVLVTGSTAGLGRGVATVPSLDGVTGRFIDGARESAAHAQASNPAARRRLGEESERLTSAA